MNIFENIDFTTLEGIVNFLSSAIQSIIDFIMIIITFPVMVGDFFPMPFSTIITIFMYISILIVLYKFFVNKS